MLLCCSCGFGPRQEVLGNLRELADDWGRVGSIGGYSQELPPVLDHIL